MIPTHATLFDGDPAECVKWLGYARGVLQQMVRDNNPAVKSKHLFIGDAEIWITKNPNAIRIKSGDKLFCTSFDAGVDDGMQIYKEPYPPKTQGGKSIVTWEKNTFPSVQADFRVRDNYWVDDKETEAVSWQYVEQLDWLALRVWYGKIAIGGCENPYWNWGKFLEPLCAGLVKTESGKKLAIIYRDRKDNNSTGDTCYLGIFSYELNKDKQELYLMRESALDLTANHYHSSTKPAWQYSDGNGGFYKTRDFLGILDGSNTVVYVETKTDTYRTRKLKYFTLSDDFSEISNDGIIYAESTEALSDGVSLRKYFNYVDIRGGTVSFVFSEDKRTELYEEGGFTAFGGIWVKTNYVDTESKSYLARWKNGETTSSFFSTSVSSRHWEGNYVPSEGIGNNSSFTVTQSVSQKKPVFYSKKTNEVIYQETTSSGSGGTGLDWSYFSSGKLVSSKLGVIFERSSASDGDQVMGLYDCSYTKKCLVASASVSGQGFSFVLDYKKKKIHLLENTELKNISVAGI